MGRRRKHNRHLPARVTHEHGAYYYRGPDRKRIRLGDTLADSLRAYALLVETPDRLATMNDVFDRYIAEHLPTLAKVTQASYLRAMGYLRPVFGHMAPGDVLPKHIYQYIDIRSEGGKKKRSANLEKSVLASVLGKAVIWGVIHSNPCKEVKRLKTTSRERLPTWAEIDAFCSVAPALIQVWCALKVATGRRQGELLALRLADLREDGIHFSTAKGGRDVIIEWTDELREVVRAAKALRRDSVRGLTLFCTRDGAPYSSDGFRSIWQRAMTKALDAGVLQERFTEHDMRATAATEAKAQGVNAQALLGHRRATTTDIYIRQKGAAIVAPVKRGK